jgi:hypothetical protein
MRTLLGLVIAAAVLTGAPALAAPAFAAPVLAAPTDPAPGVRAPGTGRLIAPAGLEPAKYGSAPRPHDPQASLTLSYLADAGFATAVKLTCDPVGGGHPEADEACAVLATIDANPDKIVPAHTACMLIYAPLTAELIGTWHGRPVNWTHRYGNSCEMRRATGVIFNF